MSQKMKVGLALSGGGAIGAYEVGIVKTLAESGTCVHAVAGASVGALNGAIVASSPTLSQAEKTMTEVWTCLANKGGNKISQKIKAGLALSGSDAIDAHKAEIMKALAESGTAAVGASVSTLGGAIMASQAILSKAEKTMTEVCTYLADNLGMPSERAVIDLLDRYLDLDALASGVPLYVSLYPTKGAITDIFNCIAAEFGPGNTRNSAFFHLQNLPRNKQKEALLASAAIPVLFKPREINGTYYNDGGMGGWKQMQGNTPVTPLVENAGCNMVIVAHLKDGSLWDRHDFPDTTILEIRPQRSLKRNEGVFGGMKDLLDFSATQINSWIEQGYQDAIIAIEHIRKPLQARQELRTSEALLKTSLAQNAQVDAELQQAMKRLK